MTIHFPTRFISEEFTIREFAFSQRINGGRGRIRTDERTKRADLQSASFSHLDTLPKVILRVAKGIIEARRLYEPDAFSFLLSYNLSIFNI